MRNLVRLSALAVMLGSKALAGLAGAQTPPVKAQPVAAPPALAPEACYTAYGLTAKQKIQVCTDVIDAGVAMGPLGSGLAYFNRGMARAQDGDSKGSISDYRTALHFYTEVIRGSAPSGQVTFQRAKIYHTMGEADQAIVDYSDAIRLMPDDVQAYVNRGIVLYSRKDNNEGALADLNAALKLAPQVLADFVRIEMKSASNGKQTDNCLARIAAETIVLRATQRPASPRLESGRSGSGLMPYAIIKRAIEEKHSLTAYYDNYLRHFSPHILGLDRQAWPGTVGWQYDGGRPGALPGQGAWCFFHVWGLTDLRPNNDGWKAGPPGGKPRHLIPRVDIEV